MTQKPSQTNRQASRIYTLLITIFLSLLALTLVVPQEILSALEIPALLVLCPLGVWGIVEAEKSTSEGRQ